MFLEFFHQLPDPAANSPAEVLVIAVGKDLPPGELAPELAVEDVLNRFARIKIDDLEIRVGSISAPAPETEVRTAGGAGPDRVSPVLPRHKDAAKSGADSNSWTHVEGLFFAQKELDLLDEVLSLGLFPLLHLRAFFPSFSMWSSASSNHRSSRSQSRR